MPFIYNYNEGDYNIGRTVYSILQGNDGIMYFGNDDGVLFYDGHLWRLITLPNNSKVQSMAKAPDGTIYIGGNEEIGYLKANTQGQLKYHSLNHLIPSNIKNFGTVWMSFAHTNEVIFKTVSNLLVYKDGAIENIPASNRFHVAFCVNNTLYVRDHTVGLLQRYPNGKLQLVPGGERFAEDPVYVMLPYTDQTTLIVSRGQGAFIYDGLTMEKWAPALDSFFVNSQVYGGIKLKDNKYVIGTLQNGAVIMDQGGNALQYLNNQTGLNSDIVHSLAVDRDDNLWLGQMNGLSQVILSSPFTVFDARSGLGNPTSSAILFENNLYLGTAQAIYTMPWQAAKGNAVPKAPHKKFARLPNFKAQVLQFSVVGNELLASTSAGIYGITGTSSYPVYEGLFVWSIKQLRQHPEKLLAGQRNGLALLQNTNGRWRYEKQVASMKLDARYIEQDAQGNIWITTEGTKLYRGRLNETLDSLVDLTAFTSQHGLPSDFNNRVFELANDVIIATESGLYAYNEASNSFMPAPAYDEINKNNTYVRWLKEDKEGNLWYWGIENYLNKANKGQYAPRFEACQLEYREEQGRRVIKKSPFFKVNETVNNALPFIYPIDEQNIAFCTSEGFIHFDPYFNYGASDDLRVLIRQVDNIAANDSLIFAGQQPTGPEKHTAAFSFGQNSLRFTVAAPYYEDSDKTMYQFYLEGFDEQWSAWSYKYSKEFTNLPPGTYKFQVRARNIYEEVSNEATYSFTILSPWYRTIWAYVTAIVLLGLIVYGVVLLNTRRLIKEKHYLEEVIKERTHEIRKKNFDLESQKQEIAQQKESIDIQNKELVELNKEKNHLIGIVAHDLRSPLNHIKGLGSLLSILSDNLSKEQKQYVSEIINSADRLNNMISKILDVDAIESRKLNINVERVLLNNVVEKVCKNFEGDATIKEISLHRNIEEGQHHALLDENYLIQVLENLVSNAIKFSEHRKNVYVNLASVEGKVRIEVKDEGQGIHPEEMHKLFGKFQRLSARPTNGEQSVGLGLSIVKKYVEAMKGRVWCESEPRKGASFFVEFSHIARPSAMAKMSQQ